MGCLKVNKKLLPVKVHYFLLNGGNAGVLPFIPVYAKQLGIEADVVGYMYAILSCVTVISKPVLGGMVDHFQKLKLVLASLILVHIASELGLSFIPAPNQDTSNSQNSSILCLQNISYILKYKVDECRTSKFTDCPIDCSSICSVCLSNNIYCNDYFLDNQKFQLNFSQNCIDKVFENCDHSCKSSCKEGTTDCTETVKVNPPLQLWLLSLFTLLMYVCNGSIVSLSDAACFNALENAPQLYGKQRLWGTIGWGAFALFAGYLNQLFTGASKIYSFSPGFYMAVVIAVVDLCIVPNLKLKNVKTSKNIYKDIGLLLAKPGIIFFILQVFFVGVFIGMSRSYLFWYLRTLNASQFLLGMVAVTQCFLGELPFFFFAGWIIAKMGHVNTFTMSIIAHGVRYLSYSFLVNPWWVLPIEILQGPCFGSFYSAMTSYSKIIAPTGTEATMQGISSATFEGLGLATGGLIGGYGFRNFDGRTTFFWTGIFTFILGLGNCITNTILVHRSHQSS